ncbi:MAG: hypothetical protein JWP21_1176 [Tardiphaga sp.]|nr:hypothetical protein [Tardiphaga sp.]
MTSERRFSKPACRHAHKFQLMLGSIDSDVIRAPRSVHILNAEETMRRFILAMLAIMTALSPIAATAQSIQVGPGGVRMYEDRPRVYEERPRVYQERRVYEDRRGHDDRPRGYDGRRRGGLCRELRRACENGPRGEGSCRRYRETCG